MNDPIVGIDLGTSNSVVAYADGTSSVKVLADDGGYKIHPSVVSFHPNGGVVCGSSAKQRKVIDPQNTIYSVKRLIGRSYRSPEVQTAQSRVPFQIKEGASQLPMIVTRGGEFAVPEISAIVLDYVRNIAAARLDAQVTRAVVTVPASFNDAQRSATATAGAIAGLTVVRVLNEPTAAALAYGNTRNLRDIIAVYDFGGGTFDISILKLEDQVYEVLGTAGDTFLGGDDLDERLVDRMVAKFLAEHRIDLRTNEVSMMRLRAVAEQTKIELSRRSRAVVRIDEIAYGPNGAPLNLHIEITRDEFVSQVADIIDKTFPVCQEALALAGIGSDKIADVILVGGTTKIPYVRDQVSKFFAKAPRTDVNPEDAVAVGAALQATSLERILSRPRRSSRSVPVQQVDEPTVDQSLDVLQLADENTESGAVMAPSELTMPARAKRTTSGYADAPRRPTTEATRPDTSYTLTKGVTRDVYEERTRPAAPNLAAELEFDSRTPPPDAQPLGRITRPAAAVPPPPIPPAPPNARTMFGVPAAPAADASPPPPPPKPTTSRVPVPPRPPRSAHRVPAQPPASIEPGLVATTSATTVVAEADSASGWLDLEETHENTASSTQPLMPTAPIAPATAPTMIAPPHDARTLDELAAGGAAPGLVDAALARLDSEFEDERGPANTARGFQAPQAFPAMPPRTAPVVLEVTPRSLGIATVAGFCEELIRRNSRLPAQMKKLFTTSRDQQDAVRIVVCQGESRRLDNNVVIGDLLLSNLPPRPRGETSIEVTFLVDASGILQVRARDAETGAEQRASLDLVGGMPQQDVAASRDRLQQLRR